MKEHMAQLNEDLLRPSGRLVEARNGEAEKTTELASQMRRLHDRVGWTERQNWMLNDRLQSHLDELQSHGADDRQRSSYAIDSTTWLKHTSVISDDAVHPPTSGTTLSRGYMSKLLVSEHSFSSFSLALTHNFPSRYTQLLKGAPPFQAGWIKHPNVESLCMSRGRSLLVCCSLFFFCIVWEGRMGWSDEQGKTHLIREVDKTTACLSCFYLHVFKG